MKENTVLHALMYIFKSTTKNQIALECIGGDMSSELSAAGFDKTVVNKAIQWILDLSNESDIEKSAQFSDLNKISYALRYFIPYECDLFFPFSRFRTKEELGRHLEGPDSSRKRI